MRPGEVSTTGAGTLPDKDSLLKNTFKGELRKCLIFMGKIMLVQKLFMQ